MPTIRYIALATALIAVGCATEAPNDSILEDENNDSAMAAQSGRFVTTMMPLSDGCQTGVSLDPPNFVDFVATEDGRHFEFDADGRPAICDATGDGSFLCTVDVPELAIFEQVSMVFEGRWTSADRFEGTMRFSIECEGDECAALEEVFSAELPCSVEATFLATRALPEEFEVLSGDYSYDVSSPIEGVSTCAGDALGVLPEVVHVQDNDGRGDFSVDDGLGELFDCSIEEGAIDCDRFLDLEEAGISFDSVVSGRWTDAEHAEATIQVTVDCSEPAGCAEAEQTFGELPCVAYHSIRLVAAPN